MGRRTLSTADALKARAGRAHEDPREMTVDALLGRLAKHAIEIIRLNPDLDDKDVARGARLKLRAEMAARSERSAEVRRARAS